jgi:hypothetical protein
MKSDQCYPPPFLNGFKHILKVVLKESGGTRPPPSPAPRGYATGLSKAKA